MTRRSQAGFTLIELSITLAIMAILVTAVIPIARNAIQHERELMLRRNLREVRQALDRYYTSCQQGLVGPLDRKVDDECYPPSLDILVQGIHPPNSTRTIRFSDVFPRIPWQD
jgi:general secretion pathway protein G